MLEAFVWQVAQDILATRKWHLTALEQVEPLRIRRYPRRRSHHFKTPLW
jgi:hypothetical protein